MPDHPSPTDAALDLAAHELRNLANVLVTGSQLLAGSGDEIAADVEGAARSLAVWVDRLIEVARAGSGEAGERRDVAVGELLRLARRRLARGPAPHHELDAPEGDARKVHVSVALAERVLADAVLVFDPAQPVTVQVDAVGTDVVVVVGGSPPAGVEPADRAREQLLTALARAAGIEAMPNLIGAVTLRMPAAPSA